MTFGRTLLLGTVAWTVLISFLHATFNWGLFEPRPAEALYCPNCAREVKDPLTCGDCSAVICRVCGTRLESSADLGIG